jgi:predicted alpha/beta hydrolase
VHNMKPVARCVSQLFTFLRNSGVQLHRTTCVGHSLGAHVCGLVSHTLQFRMHRIIGTCCTDVWAGVAHSAVRNAQEDRYAVDIRVDSHLKMEAETISET